MLEGARLNSDTDIRKQSLGAAQSVDALKDGKIDAFFWSGGIPTGSVLDLASTPGRTIKLVPNTDTLPFLHERYGDSVYHAVTIPNITYPGMSGDVEVVGVANILVVHDDMSEESGLPDHASALRAPRRAGGDSSRGGETHARERSGRLDGAIPRRRHPLLSRTAGLDRWVVAMLRRRPPISATTRTPRHRHDS